MHTVSLTPPYSRDISYRMRIKLILLGLCLITISSGCFGKAPSSSSATLFPATLLIPTSTNTIIPTPTVTPTQLPEVRIAEGDQALFNGDFNLAANNYQDVLNVSSNPELIASALWGLGRTEDAVDSKGRALEIFQQLINDYPDFANTARAYFLMGEIFMSLERYIEAAQAYAEYLTRQPGVIDSFVQERRGDALAASGNDVEAVLAYQSAFEASHLGDFPGLEIKIAQSYINLGKTTEAIGILDAIFSTTTNDYLKAQMDLQIGQIYMSVGETGQAYERFLHAVNHYPLAYDSYSALVVLVNAGIPVDEMDRGLVDYYAGQYGYAIDAFTRYLAANPQNDGSAIFFTAKSQAALGDYTLAIETYTYFIANYPENEHWQDAWEEIGSIQSALLFEYEAAAQTYLKFIQQYPANEKVPDYLMLAGRNLERLGNLPSAAQTWERISNEYPSSPLVPQALFWVGITQYRLKDYNAALLAFQRGSLLAIDLEDKIRAQFWIGKSQQSLGDDTSARAAWQQAAALDPVDYYSLRAQDLLFNHPAFDRNPTINKSLDLSLEKLEADSWLRVTFGLPASTDLSSPGPLLSDPRLIRGTEFARLGLDEMARNEFDSLQTEYENDPVATYCLANYMLDLKLYYPAIFAIRQVLTLAGMSTQAQTLAAPAYFNHFRYGLYYQELVFPAAKQSDLDPLFIQSVMRQESLFNKLAGSGQGALGLMQMTPDTGQLVSDNLGWPPNYSTADLYRPVVSIVLGASFLQTQSLRFEGDLFTTLAAYNGGQNAAPIWRELSGPDSDLFLEVIRPEETRDYIRSVYEIFAMYRMLYATTP